MSHSNLIVPFTILCVLPIAAYAGGAAVRQATLEHGPLIGGSPRVFELSTTAPNATAWIFRSSIGQPSLSTVPLFPDLAIGTPWAPIVAQTDAAGRLRVVVPTSPGVYAPGTSWFQALVRAQDGTWVASNARAVRREPTVAPPGFLTDVALQVLPAAYASVAATSLQPFDCDRDGRTDLVLGSDAGLFLWRRTVSGFVDETAQRVVLPLGPVAHVACADWDHDGDTDFFTAGGNAGHPDRLWVNDGSGVFTHLIGFPPGSGQTQSVEFGDLDLDGDLDLVLAMGGNGHGPTAPAARSQVYFQQAGSFVPDPSFEAQAWNNGLVGATALRLADVDGDLDLDLFVARSDFTATNGTYGERNRLLVNDGTGHFLDESATRLSPWYEDNSYDATWIDVDLDGDLDLAVANAVTSVPCELSGDLYLNQGGVLIEDASSPLETNATDTALRLYVRAGDIDSDGDADLLFGVHDAFPVAHQLLLLNQGGAQAGALGAYAREVGFDPGSFIASDAALFDDDFDGDLDVLIGALGSFLGNPAQATSLRFLRNTIH